MQRHCEEPKTPPWPQNDGTLITDLKVTYGKFETEREKMADKLDAMLGPDRYDVTRQFAIAHGITIKPGWFLDLVDLIPSRYATLTELFLAIRATKLEPPPVKVKRGK